MKSIIKRYLRRKKSRNKHQLLCARSIWNVCLRSREIEMKTRAGNCFNSRFYNFCFRKLAWNLKYNNEEKSFWNWAKSSEYQKKAKFKLKTLSLQFLRIPKLRILSRLNKITICLNNKHQNHLLEERSLKFHLLKWAVWPYQPSLVLTEKLRKKKM